MFTRHLTPLKFCGIVLCALPILHGQQPDTRPPASMETFQIPSHGALLNALVYVAAGAGPHRAVILLHGFPGNERNLDLAQDMRRAGWDVLYFNYHGSWGSPVGLISAADVGGRIPQPLPKDAAPAAIQALSASLAREGVAPLANAAQWRFQSKEEALKSRPVLIVTSNDGLSPANAAFAETLPGNEKVTTLHLATDHSYSYQRAALSTAVLQWLAPLNSHQ
jgi:dienelactone hydrolase